MGAKWYFRLGHSQSRSQFVFGEVAGGATDKQLCGCKRSRSFGENRFSRWWFQIRFFGSLIFLLGYIIMSWRMPPKFGGGPDIVTVVSNMLKVQDFKFFSVEIISC